MNFHLFLVLKISLIFLIIVSQWVFLYSSTMAWFHCHHLWLFFLGCFSYFSHFPWVWPLVRIAAYIQITLLRNHIVVIYPLRSLCLNLSSVLSTKPPMVIYLELLTHLYPLFFLQVVPQLNPLFFLISDHPSKLTRINDTAAPRW